jgi:hypothetical protein
VSQRERTPEILILTKHRWLSKGESPRILSFYIHAFLQKHRSCLLEIDLSDGPLGPVFVIKELESPKEHGTSTTVGNPTHHKKKTIFLGWSEMSANYSRKMGTSSIDISSVKEYLRSETRTEVDCVDLDFLFLNAGLSHFRFEPFGSKFSAMRKLVLRFYCWDHSESEVQEMWDFSRLRSLVLHGKAMKFLQHAPVNELTRLDSLTLRVWGSHERLQPDLGSFSNYLRALLLKLPNLKKLKIEQNLWSRYTPIDAIINMPNLEKLVLHENGGMYYNAARHPPALLMLRTFHLAQLQSSCPSLTSLGLDFYLSNAEVSSPPLRLVPDLRIHTNNTKGI